MERRLHDRVRVQFEAQVTGPTNREPVRGIVSDISSAGLSIILPVPIATGDLIQLEMADSIVIGRVVYSTAETSQFRTGIEVHEVRLGSTELSHLLQKTLREAMPDTPSVEYSETLLD